MDSKKSIPVTRSERGTPTILEAYTSPMPSGIIMFADSISLFKSGSFEALKTISEFGVTIMVTPGSENSFLNFSIAVSLSVISTGTPNISILSVSFIIYRFLSQLQIRHGLNQF